MIRARHLFDGEVWLENVELSFDHQGRIEAIEPIPSDADFDAKIIIPGLPNTHSHSFQKAMSGRGELRTREGGDSFWTWRNTMYDLVQKLKTEDHEIIARFLYAQMLQNGFTGVGEFHYVHFPPGGKEGTEGALQTFHSIQNAADTTGIRLCFLPVLYETGGFGKKLQEDQLPFSFPSLQDFLNAVAGIRSELKSGFQCGLALHSLRAVSKESLLELKSGGHLEGIPVHIHISEQQKEVEDCLNFYGRRPVDFLFETLRPGENFTLVHATHLAPREVQLIAKSGAIVSICPITEANLGDGVFPLESFLNQGGKFCVGSDSHVLVDSFEELRMLEYSQRLTRMKRSILCKDGERSPGKSLFKECLKSGSKSIKAGKGVLQTGEYADFLVLNENLAELFPLDLDCLFDQLVFSNSRAVIRDVYIGGVRKVKNGYHVDFDEICSSYRDLMQRIYS